MIQSVSCPFSESKLAPMWKGSAIFRNGGDAKGNTSPWPVLSVAKCIRSCPHTGNCPESSLQNCKHCRSGLSLYPSLCRVMYMPAENFQAGIVKCRSFRFRSTGYIGPVVHSAHRGQSFRRISCIEYPTRSHAVQPIRSSAVCGRFLLRSFRRLLRKRHRFF